MPQDPRQVGSISRHGARRVPGEAEPRPPPPRAPQRHDACSRNPTAPGAASIMIMHGCVRRPSSRHASRPRPTGADLLEQSGEMYRVERHREGSRLRTMFVGLADGAVLGAGASRYAIR